MDAATGQEAATEIVVANTSDEVDGDTSSAAALQANPGPDGISLREAIMATNSDPQEYVIHFDESLAGSTIGIKRRIGSTSSWAEGGGLPQLTGGSVSIDGDIDGDGDPDVTIAPAADEQPTWGFSIASSGNRLDALVVRDFPIGVELTPPFDPFGPSLPTHQMYANNVVTNMIILGVSGTGIGIDSVPVEGGDCPGVTGGGCETYNTWTKTTIVGNRIEGRWVPGVDGPRGIRANMGNVGDVFEHATITDNSIEFRGRKPDAGIALLGGSLDSTDARVFDVLIARNTVEGSVETGITVNAGDNRAQAGVTDNVRVVDNRIHLVKEGSSWHCCDGIIVKAGGDNASFAIGPPVRYLNDNHVRDVVIRGNRVTGTLEFGVYVQAGKDGGRRNRIQNLRITNNVIRTSRARLGVFVIGGGGVAAAGASATFPSRDRYGTDNRVSGLTIRANRIRIATGRGARYAGFSTGAGGVVLLGGHEFSRDNRVRGVRIAANTIRTAYVGVRVYGGRGETAQRNRVICVPLSGNRFVGARKKVLVRSNVDGAKRNRARLGGC